MDNTIWTQKKRRKWTAAGGVGQRPQTAFTASTYLKLETFPEDNGNKHPHPFEHYGRHTELRDAQIGVRLAETKGLCQSAIGLTNAGHRV